MYRDRGTLDPFFHEVIDHRMADLELTDAEVARRCGRSNGWVRTLRLGPRTFLPTPDDLAALADALEFTVDDVRDLLIYSAGYEVGHGFEPLDTLDRYGLLPAIAA